MKRSRRKMHKLKKAVITLLIISILLAVGIVYFYK